MKKSLGFICAALLAGGLAFGQEENKNAFVKIEKPVIKLPKIVEENGIPRVEIAKNDVNVSKYKLKSTKTEKAVVGAYKKVEDGVVNGYKAVENTIVCAYKAVEKKFVDKFLENVEVEKEEN